MPKTVITTLICFLLGCATSSFRPLPTSEYFPKDIIFSEPKSVAEVEATGLDEVKKSGRHDIPALPFGFMNDHWVQMKKKIQPGDRLVFFTSQPKDWENLCGMEGCALIRGDMVLDVLLTKVN